MAAEALFPKLETKSLVTHNMEGGGVGMHPRDLNKERPTLGRQGG